MGEEKAAERGGYGGERYEQLEFQKKVAQFYHKLFDASWKIVDATLTIEEIEEQLRGAALDCLIRCQKGEISLAAMALLVIARCRFRIS